MDEDPVGALAAALEREVGVDAELARWCAERHDAGDSSELLQLVLLRALWREAVGADPQSPLSVTRWPALAEGGFPFVDGAAAQRLLDAGASPEDLDALVSSAQALALYNACEVLDDGGWKLLAQIGVERLGWAVVAQDPAITPPGSLGGLHATFEQLDPRRTK